MNECRRVALWLEESVWQEWSSDRERRVAAHTERCPDCRELQRALRLAAREMAAIADRADREAASVDWAEVNRRILDRVEAAPVAVSVPLWPRLAAAAAALLVLAGSAWLWLSGVQGRRAVAPDAGAYAVRLSRPALQRIETSLSDGETRAYLEGSRMLLSGVMGSCRERPLEAWEAQLYSRQAKDLLLRQRYLNRSPAGPGGQRVQEIGGRLSWVLMEIAAIQPGASCRQLEEIRTLAGRENLLLKLRLLEDEMSGRAIEEV